MNFYLDIFVYLIFVFIDLPGSFGYIKLNFENERTSLCSKIKLLGVRTEYLRHHDNSGLIVEEDYKIHANHWQEDLICLFKVNYPPETDGVIAVIQSLSMRRNDSSGQCIDYIQFTAKDGTSSNPFCGKFDVVSKMNSKTTDLDKINYENSYRTKKHKLHVYIKIGRQPHIDKTDQVQFKIVFTAYKNCSDQSVMDLTYRPCEESSDFCIYNGFFNDDYVNCPVAGCVDEGSCTKFMVLPNPPSLGTKLLVSSISFFFVLFITFFISIWACKKHKVVCFSEQFSHPERSRQSRVIDMNTQESAITSERSQGPSAPPIEVDKDLPPKYEDLFPDR